MRNEFDWERFKLGAIVIHCDTKEKAKDFMKECNSKGIKWLRGQNTLEYTNFYPRGNNTCYLYESGLISRNIKDYNKEGYEIIDWGDNMENVENDKECIEFNWEEFKKEKIYVHCDTEEKAKDFIKKAFENNCGWMMGDSSETYFKEDLDKTCYILSGRYLVHVSLDDRSHKGCTVIEWEVKQDNSESNKGENSNMKYSIGDKVKIREDLQKGKMYNFHYDIINEMLELKGKTAIITKYIPNEYYELDIDNGEYCWTDEMLEDTNPTKTIRSFAELMANHGENQIWESLDNSESIKRVIFKDWGINFVLNKDLYELKDCDINEFGINNNCRFRLITHKDTIKANFQQYIDEEYPIIDLQLKDGNSIGFKTEKQKYKFEDDYILITAEGYEMKIKYDAIECVAI